MLTKAGTLKGARLRGLDGDMGSVRDFYFDDHHWTLRYVVADTGNWLQERQVLIAPYALTAVAGDPHHLDVALTKQQIEDSPSLDEDKPVSKQFETAYYGYYQWPSYWGGPERWGYYPHVEHDREQWQNDASGADHWDPHLRSTNNMNGYRVYAGDDDIGHVDDFIIEDETWAIRYLVVDTGHWWSEKKIVASPRWIDRISWSESTVFLTLPPETVKGSPEYSEASLPTRDYETRLHRHYDRRGYWDDEAKAAVPR